VEDGCARHGIVGKHSPVGAFSFAGIALSCSGAGGVSSRNSCCYMHNNKRLTTCNYFVASYVCAANVANLNHMMLPLTRMKQRPVP